MLKAFGLPIIIGIIAAFYKPGIAIDLAPYSFIPLFVLMFTAGLVFDWSQLSGIKTKSKELGMGLFLAYVLFPAIQITLALFLVQDKAFQVGLIFAAMTPLAIVAPSFCQMKDADASLSFKLLLTSMVIAPLGCFILFKGFFADLYSINFMPLMRWLIVLITLPTLMAYLFKRFLPKLVAPIAPAIPHLNMLLLTVLIFILFGKSTAKFNFNYVSTGDMVGIFLFHAIQDFGTFFLIPLLAGNFGDVKTRRTFRITLSMKNIALSSGLLIFYEPKAALASALGFIFHAFIFTTVVNYPYKDK